MILNFLMAYALLVGMFMITGIGEATTSVAFVSTELSNGDPTPATLAGAEVGDTILTVDGVTVAEWQETVDLIAARPNETVIIEVDRNGSVVPLEVTLATNVREDGSEVGFFGVAPDVEMVTVGPFESLGLAARAEYEVTKLAFTALARIVHPESLVELGGALFGDTEVSDEIRPVSPIGLVQIGAQAGTIGFDNIVFLLASVNIILGIFNGLPLYPLDGGHFAVALYEKVSGREANVRKLLPVAATVITIMLFLGVVAIVLDLTNPISL